MKSKNITVLDMQGKTVEKVSLDETLFNGQVNKTLLHQALLMYMANTRKGTASTKTRAEVRGGGRKPWRQKGTGRARVGSNRNPIWRGGGITFGPKPRSFYTQMPKQMRSLALIQSLNGKIKNDQFVIVDNISIDQLKTKKIKLFLDAIKSGPKPLVVIEKKEEKISLAARNIPGCTVKAFNYINAHDVLKHQKVIFTKQALENLVKLRKD